MKKERNKKTIINRKVKIICVAVACVLLIAMITIVILDANSKTKLYITNDTDKNIEYVRVTFYENDIYEYDDEYIRLDPELDFIYRIDSVDNIKAGEKRTVNYGSPILYVQENNNFYYCNINVKFEGEDELMIEDEGYFTQTFDGILRLKFYQKDGVYRLHTKAGVGAFENASDFEMDDELVIDFDHGFIYDLYDEDEEFDSDDEDYFDSGWES